MSAKTFVKSFTKFIQENSPAILTGLGVGGLVGTSILSVRAGIKTQKYISDCTDENIEYKEILKNVWTYYIPPAMMGGVSIACILNANTINTKRNAAIASLYSVSEEALKIYENKLEEKLTPKKLAEFREEAIVEKSNDGTYNPSQIIITGKGDMLIYDTISGRYFNSDIEIIRRIVNDLNQERLSSMWINLNDLYYALGLETVAMGDDMGWDVDNKLDIKIATKLTEDNKPCIVLDYKVYPKFK